MGSATPTEVGGGGGSEATEHIPPSATNQRVRGMAGKGKAVGIGESDSSSKMEGERYRSGHNGADSKSAVRLTADRGFESHPLRHVPCKVHGFAMYKG